MLVSGVNVFFLGSRWERCAVNVGVYGYPNTVNADPGFL